MQYLKIGYDEEAAAEKDVTKKQSWTSLAAVTVSCRNVTVHNGRFGKQTLSQITTALLYTGSLNRTTIVGHIKAKRLLRPCAASLRQEDVYAGGGEAPRFSDFYTIVHSRRRESHRKQMHVVSPSLF
jgi:hypothetical protein